MDPKICREAFQKTAPDKFDKLSVQDMESCYHILSACMPDMDDRTKIQYRQRLDQLRLEIQKHQHRELSGIGNKTLEVGKKALAGTEKTVYWARWAVLAAVAYMA